MLKSNIQAACHAAFPSHCPAVVTASVGLGFEVGIFNFTSTESSNLGEGRCHCTPWNGHASGINMNPLLERWWHTVFSAPMPTASGCSSQWCSATAPSVIKAAMPNAEIPFFPLFKPALEAVATMPAPSTPMALGDGDGDNDNAPSGYKPDNGRGIQWGWEAVLGFVGGTVALLAATGAIVIRHRRRRRAAGTDSAMHALQTTTSSV
jgi:hypothetical protein